MKKKVLLLNLGAIVSLAIPVSIASSCSSNEMSPAQSQLLATLNILKSKYKPTLNKSLKQIDLGSVETDIDFFKKNVFFEEINLDEYENIYEKELISSNFKFLNFELVDISIPVQGNIKLLVNIKNNFNDEIINSFIYELSDLKGSKCTVIIPSSEEQSKTKLSNLFNIEIKNKIIQEIEPKVNNFISSHNQIISNKDNKITSDNLNQNTKIKEIIETSINKNIIENNVFKKIQYIDSENIKISKIQPTGHNFKISFIYYLGIGSTNDVTFPTEGSLNISIPNETFNKEGN